MSMRDNPGHGTPTTPPPGFDVIDLGAPPARRWRPYSWEVRDTVIALAFLVAGIVVGVW